MSHADLCVCGHARSFHAHRYEDTLRCEFKTCNCNAFREDTRPRCKHGRDIMGTCGRCDEEEEEDRHQREVDALQASLDNLRGRVMELETIAIAARRYLDSPECGRAGGWRLRLELDNKLREAVIPPKSVLDQLLHPNGKCTCAGEGTCEWCLTTCMECGVRKPCAEHAGE